MTALPWIGAAASLVVAEGAQLISPLAEDLEEIGKVTLEHARRTVVFVIGSTLLLLGLALVTAGPGLLLLPGAPAVLGVEFEWASRWLARTREAAQSVEDFVRRRRGG